MGLDQYAYARRGEPKIELEEYTYTDLATGERRTGTEENVIYEDQMELAYWRKHPNLQGWMEDLWKSKGNQGEFNCVDVELTSSDLEDLENIVEQGKLPETQGFFFGSDSDDHYKEGDLEFIREARQHLADGYKIVYTSWW